MRRQAALAALVAFAAVGSVTAVATAAPRAYRFVAAYRASCDAKETLSLWQRIVYSAIVSAGEA